MPLLNVCHNYIIILYHTCSTNTILFKCVGTECPNYLLFLQTSIPLPLFKVRSQLASYLVYDSIGNTEWDGGIEGVINASNYLHISTDGLKSQVSQ